MNYEIKEEKSYQQLDIMSMNHEGESAAQAPLLQVNKELDIGKAAKMWNTMKTRILDDFGFRLFTRLKFWILTFGLGVAYTSDILFFHLIRTNLNSLHFRLDDISLSLMTFFLADIVGRLIYAISSRYWTFKNRYIFLTASIFINASRIMYFFRDDYKWKITTIGMVGVLRAFIQTPIPLVINENHKNNFPRAYSMFSVLSGLISLSFSSLTSFIKSYIGDDAMVVYVYAGINYFCCLTWFIDIFYSNVRKWFSTRRDNN